MRKKLSILVALFAGILLFSACNKGDDNPYRDWKCTCFVTKVNFVDTIQFFKYDTVYLQAEDMDLKTASSFCESAKQGYYDTLGSNASCILK